MACTALSTALLRSTWDTGPVLSLGHCRQLGELVARRGNVQAVIAVHEELRRLMEEASDDKPWQAAVDVYDRGALDAPVEIVIGRREVEEVQRRLGPDDALRQSYHHRGRDRGEAHAILHARQAGVTLVVNDRAAGTVARAEAIATACTADLLSELVVVGDITLDDAIDIAADLKQHRLDPGRPLTGTLDLRPGDEFVLCTEEEWDGGDW